MTVTKLKSHKRQQIKAMLGIPLIYFLFCFVFLRLFSSCHSSVMYYFTVSQTRFLVTHLFFFFFFKKKWQTITNQFKISFIHQEKSDFADNLRPWPRLACLLLPFCTEVCCPPRLCPVCVGYQGLLICELISGSDYRLSWYLVGLVRLCTLFTPLITISFPSSARSARPRASLHKHESYNHYKTRICI